MPLGVVSLMGHAGAPPNVVESVLLAHTSALSHDMCGFEQTNRGLINLKVCAKLNLAFFKLLISGVLSRQWQVDQFMMMMM